MRPCCGSRPGTSLREPQLLSLSVRNTGDSGPAVSGSSLLGRPDPVALSTTPGSDVRSGRKDGRLVPDSSQRGAPGTHGDQTRGALCRAGGGTQRAPLLTGHVAAAEEGQGLADWGRRKATSTPPTKTCYVLRQREVQSKRQLGCSVQVQPRPGGAVAVAARGREHSGPEGAFRPSTCTEQTPQAWREVGSHIPTHS